MAETATGESSITEYVDDYRDLSISFDTLHLKESAESPADSSGVTKTILLGESFVQKYKGDLEDLIQEKTFNANEYAKYMCNPWALSYDLYGTVEFWFLILDLNNMYSAIEFTQRSILIYDGSLPDVVDTIIASEEPFIDNNNAEIDGTANTTDINDSDDDDDIEESED